MEFPIAFTDVREDWVRGFCFVHSSMCWRVVLFLRTVAKVGLSFFPRPLTSMTKEGLLDHQTPFAR